jgi:hypothetical protein
MRSLLLLLALSLAVPAAAVERASAKASRERPSATLDQVSIKPLLIFSMRDRPDPFMSYALLTVTASTQFFNIANLFYSGMLQVDGAKVALFKDTQGQSYSLKGAGLYGPDGQSLAGVRGRISPAGQVQLEQGEKKINYTAKSTSKRLDGGSTHDRDH